MFSRRRFAAAWGAAFVLAALAGSPFPALAKIALVKPQPVRVHAPAAGSAPAYTVVDRGAPPANLELYYSVAFNNTGQIVGSGADSDKGAYNGNSCLLFDGKQYRDISTLPALTNCVLNGMNDVGATGTLDVVGYANTATAPGFAGESPGNALYIAVTPTAKLFRTAVFTNDESSLVGVNAGGTAAGFGAYNPLDGFVTATPPFVTTATAGSLQLLQPACTTPQPGCGETPIYEGDQIPCGFGGCDIAADGSLLLYDLFYGSYEIVAPDGTARELALDATIDTIPIMNGVKQVVYAAETVVAGQTVLRTHIYSASTGTIAAVPPLPGIACRQYVPLSINNHGAILGVASDCGTNYGQFYFTYDPAHGSQALPATLPGAYYGFSPTAINDKNQILVTLQLSNGGPTHWGYLQPSTSAARRGRPAPVTTMTVARGPLAAPVTPPRGLRAMAERAKRAPLLATAAGSAQRGIDLRFLPRAAGAKYTLVDYGAPPAATYTLEAPVAFNNDGQIIGTAFYVPYRNNTACLIFDGAAFRNLNGTSVVDCTPLSINDVNAKSASVTVVGHSTSAFDVVGDTKAFVSLVTPKSGAVATHRFAGNESSELVGVNAAGAALGQGSYEPTYGTDAYGPGLFGLAPGANTLAIVPACINEYACNGYIQDQACAFGGCYITSDGTLFITTELILPNGTIRAVHLDSNAYRPIINNAGQLLYADGQNTELYELSTGKATMIPRLPGNGWNYRPLSFNNEGHVLGSIDYDSSQPNSYYLYDAAHGTRNLSALLPAANAMLLPVAINDKDQILAQLVLPSGVNHWGILTPPAGTDGNRPADARPGRWK